MAIANERDYSGTGGNGFHTDDFSNKIREYLVDSVDDHDIKEKK